jgi:DNA-binding NarL/FixJ family response regulator
MSLPKRYTGKGMHRTMQPQAYLDHVRLLRQVIRELSNDWSLLLCTRDQCLVAITTLLLERAIPVAESTTDLLALAPTHDQRLLVICDDIGGDGGAEELMLQMRHHHGPKRCHFLVGLERDVPQQRLERLWRSGAHAILCWQNCGEGQMMQAMAVVMRGNTFLDPSLGQRLRRPLAHTALNPDHVKLTAREEELVRLTAHGRNSRDIAALKQMRDDSVRHMLSTLYQKTGVRSRDGLLAWGLEHGLIRPHDLRTRLKRRSAVLHSVKGGHQTREHRSPSVQGGA